MKMGRGVCAHLRVPSFYFVSDVRCALLSTRAQKPPRRMSHEKRTIIPYVVFLNKKYRSRLENSKVGDKYQIL